MSTHRFEGQPLGVHSLDWQASRMFRQIEQRREAMHALLIGPVPVGSRRRTKRRQAQSLLQAPLDERAAILGAADEGLQTELENWLGPMYGTLMQYINPLPQGGAPPEEGGVIQ